MAKTLIFVLLVFAATGFLVFIDLPMNSINSSQPQTRFRYVSGGDSGEYASYVFHSSKERIFKTYDDCLGCDPYEDGDTHLWRQFMSKKDAERTFEGYGDADSSWRIEKDSDSQEGPDNHKIAVLNDSDGKIATVRLLWIEPTERAYAYWFIEAPTVSLTKEFEGSDTFRKLKKTMASEPPNCDTYGSNSANYDWCQ